MHPKIWPIILELTGGRPQMNGPGTMIVDDAQVRPPPPQTHAGWLTRCWLALQLRCRATARWNLGVALLGSTHSCSVDVQHTVADPQRAGSGWHCAAEGNGGRAGNGHELARMVATDQGTLYCTNFVIFPCASTAICLPSLT